jgi:hypothetical protein
MLIIFIRIGEFVMQLIDIIAFSIVATVNATTLLLFVRNNCKLRILKKTLEEKNWCDMDLYASEKKGSLSFQIKKTKQSLNNNRKLLIMSFWYAVIVFLSYIT